MCICVQVEEAVSEQHAGDGHRASLSAWPAGAAGTLFGPNGGDEPRSGRTHHLSASASGNLPDNIGGAAKVDMSSAGVWYYCIVKGCTYKHITI